MSDPEAATVQPDATSSAAQRGLKAVVIFLGALIVVAFALLVIGLVTRFSAKGGSHAATAEKTIALPAGSEILKSELQDDRLILHVAGPTGEEIYIVDTGNGHLVGRVQPKPPPIR